MTPAVAAAIAASDAVMALMAAAAAALLAGLGSRLGSERLSWAAGGLSFLAASGILGAAMALTHSARAAASLYTASTAAAAVGLAMMAAAQRVGGPAALLLAPVAVLPVGLDFAAAASGGLAALGGRGPARWGLLMLSIAHALRGAALLLAPLLGRPLAPLALAEAVRASAVAVMLGYYAAGSRGHAEA